MIFWEFKFLTSFRKMRFPMDELFEVEDFDHFESNWFPRVKN